MTISACFETRVWEYRITPSDVHNHYDNGLKQKLNVLGGAAVQSEASGDIVGALFSLDQAQSVLSDPNAPYRRDGVHLTYFNDLLKPSAQGLSSAKVITLNGQPEFMFVTPKYVQKHWNRMMLNVKPEFAVRVAPYFGRDAYPHQMMDAGRYKLLQHNWRLPTPHVQMIDYTRNGTPMQLAEEINDLGKPVLVTAHHDTVQARLAPLAMLDQFVEAGVEVTSMKMSDLRDRTSSLAGDVVSVVQQKHPVKRDMMLAVGAQPSEAIASILDGAYAAPPMTYAASDNYRDQFEAVSCAFGSTKAAINIAYKFRKAVEKQSVSGIVLQSKRGEECFVGAIGAPKVVDLLSRGLPLAPVAPNIGCSRPQDQDTNPFYSALRGHYQLVELPRYQQEDIANAAKHALGFVTKRGKNLFPVFAEAHDGDHGDRNVVGYLTTSEDIYYAATQLQHLTS